MLTLQPHSYIILGQKNATRGCARVRIVPSIIFIIPIFTRKMKRKELERRYTVIVFTRVPNRRVLIVSSLFSLAGEQQIIIVVFALPPNDCLNTKMLWQPESGCQSKVTSDQTIPLNLSPQFLARFCSGEIFCTIIDHIDSTLSTADFTTLSRIHSNSYIFKAHCSATRDHT